MPQLQLPIFPVSSTPITSDLAFIKNKETREITYVYGTLPVFTHHEDDLKSFRMITSQFCVSGHAKQMDIVRAFGVNVKSVKRAVKKYREEGGPSAFYKKRNVRSSTVLTAPVCAKIQELLDAGENTAQIAIQLTL